MISIGTCYKINVDMRQTDTHSLAPEAISELVNDWLTITECGILDTIKQRYEGALAWDFQYRRMNDGV